MVSPFPDVHGNSWRNCGRIGSILWMLPFRRPPPLHILRHEGRFWCGGNQAVRPATVAIAAADGAGNNLRLARPRYAAVRQALEVIRCCAFPSIEQTAAEFDKTTRDVFLESTANRMSVLPSGISPSRCVCAASI